MLVPPLVTQTFLKSVKCKIPKQAFLGELVGWDEYELPLKFLHGRLVKCEQKSKYFVIILLRGGE